MLRLRCSSTRSASSGRVGTPLCGFAICRLNAWCALSRAPTHVPAKPSKMLLRMRASSLHLSCCPEMRSMAMLPHGLGVMHVCQHLRQVALDARELWSLNLKHRCNRRRLRAQLVLAGEASLTIWAGDVTSLDGWIASRLGNTKSACLTLGESMRELTAALDTPKPLLRQLEVDFTSSRGYSVESTFLGGLCENLTHLSLLGAVVNVPPSLPSLICLRVQNLGGDVWHKVLAALLRQSPRLEELSVAQMHKQTSPSAVDDGVQQACLPLLREVEVRIYDACRLHDILRLIPPPQQHFTAAQLSMDDPPAASNEHMYALLKTFWPGTACPVGALTLSPQSLEWRHRGRIIGKITLESESDSLPGSGPAFSFDIERLDGSEIGPSYWPHVHTLRLPVQSADQLVRENGSSWLEVEHLSSLRTLVLFGTLGETDKWTKSKDVLSWLGRRAIAGDTIDTIVYAGSIVINRGISEMLWFTTADLGRLMLGLVHHRVTTANHEKIPVVKRAVWRQQGMVDRIWVS